MNTLPSEELALFSQELQRLLSPMVLQHIAKQVAHTSFTQLCSRLEASMGVLMSPEGLNQRFNPTDVTFLREVFTSLLTQKLCATQSLDFHMLSLFNRIRILDATVFQLPDAFATDYQDSGGCRNTAGVKIQLEYDLLSGQFLNVQLGHGKTMTKSMRRTVLKV